MAEKYTGVEKYIFSDVYNFFLKYANVPNEDYYWERCISDAKLLYFKYRNYPLAKRMVMDVLEQLEFRLCNKAIDGMTYQQWEAYLGDYKSAKPFSPKTYSDKL